MYFGDDGFIPTWFDDSVQLFIGACATGRATAASTTLDMVAFAKLDGQAVATTFTPADVGCPVLIVGGGAVDANMPDVWEVQGAPFWTTIAAYVSPSHVTLADAPITSFYNTGFFNIVVFRRCPMQLDSWNVTTSNSPGTRDVLDCVTLTSHNSYLERFSVIVMGQPILLRSLDPEVVNIIGGFIDTITRSNLVGTPGTFSYQLHCAGNDGIASRRVVNPAFPNIFTGDCAEVFAKIALTYLSDEGVGIIATSGPTITVACPIGAYVNTLLDQVVQQLAAAGEKWYWYADAYRNYILAPRAQTAAPWDILDGSDLLAGQQPIQLQVTESHDQLATVSFALGQNILLNAIDGIIVGDGIRTAFDLPQKLATVPTIELNGGPQTVGILGIDSGKDWYWNQGSTTLTQDSGGTILTAADTLTVQYQFTYAGVASSPNYLGAVERQRSEAGSGSYDHVIQVSNTVTSDQLLSIVESYSAQYGIPARTAKLSTLRPGIKIGQLQAIKLDAIGIDDTFLVATVKLSSRDKVLQWDYTAYNGANVGDGVTGLVQFINRGEGTLQLLQPLVPITAAGTPAAAPGQNVIGKTAFGVGVSFPSPVTQGSLLVMVAERNSVLGNPPATTDSQGNTWTQAIFAQTGGGFPNQISVLYTFASVSGACEVFCASAEWQALMEFTGVDDTSPVDVTGSGVGAAPTLTVTDARAIVVTGLANCVNIPTVSGGETLLGYRQNTSQPGIAYSYKSPGVTGAFTSSLDSAGGGSATVWASVAFKARAGTAPPAQTITVNVNPSGNVTNAGLLTADAPIFGNGGAGIKAGSKTGNTDELVSSDGTVSDQGVLVYDANGNATALPIGADGEFLQVVSGAAAWGPGGGGGGSGVLGTAAFSATGGVISNSVVTGVVASVTRSAVGVYSINLSPSQSGFTVALAVSDDATVSTSIALFGTPNLNSSLSAVPIITATISAVPATRDPGMVSVTLLKF